MALQPVTNSKSSKRTNGVVTLESHTTPFNSDAGPPSGPQLVHHAKQAIAGVVLKYVNFAQGWQPRLLVVEDDTVKYWKLGADSQLNMFTLFEQLRANGDLKILGLKAVRMENEGRMKANGDGSNHGIPEPAAAVSLKVCRIRESKRDAHKFKIDTGNGMLYIFRAADSEERWRWVNLLKTAQEAWTELHHQLSKAISFRPPTADGGTAEQSSESDLRAEVKEQLTSKGASADIIAYVDAALVRQQTLFKTALAEAEERRQTLLRLANNLADQKNELEQQLTLGTADARAAPPQASVSDDMEESGKPSGPIDIENGALESDESDIDADLFADAEHDSAWLQRISITSTGSGRKLSTASTTDAAAAARRSSASGGVDAATRQPVASVHEEQGVALQRVDTEAVLAKRPVPAWLKQEGPAPKRRQRLPRPQQSEKPVSLWAIIKEMIGKDLTRVCLPVYFNEPLSALQKIAEDLEYSELLDKAAECSKGSVERLLHLSAFCISGYSATIDRTSKPFNPLLGETYELVCQEKGVRFLAEKVVHHPTIIAAVAEGAGWTLQGDAEVKSKFWGRSIELIPEGTLMVTFHDGEAYSWNKVTTYINNLILGKIYVDHGGIMKISCPETNMTARIRFKESGMLYDKNPRQIRGHIERGKEKVPNVAIRGHWDQEVVADMPDGSVWRLWKKSPPAVEPTRYNLTSWAITLNELTTGLKDKLAPTDCRLRPDQHYLELGMYDEANAEKQRLEQKQRAARKAAERGDPIQPRWFDSVDRQAHRGLGFRYKGGYWEARQKGKYDGCRDIFGPTAPTQGSATA